MMIYAGDSRATGLEDALQRDSQGDVRHTLPAQDANLRATTGSPAPVYGPVRHACHE